MTPGPDRRSQLVLVSSVRSKKLARVSVVAEALYYKLLLLTDDMGRFPASPLLVGAACFEHRMEAGELAVDDIQLSSRHLEEVGLISIYEVDGDRYLEITELYRPIRKDRKAVVKYPARGSGSQLDVNGGHLDDNWQDTPPPPPPPALHTPPPPPPPTCPPVGGQKRAKPRRDGKAELASAVESWEAAHGSMRSDLLGAMEGYRQRRQTKRHPLYDAGQWTATLAVGEGDQECLIEAFKTADRSGWQSVHPKPGQNGEGGPASNMSRTMGVLSKHL